MKQKILNFTRLRALMLVALLSAAFTGAWAEDVVFDFKQNTENYGSGITPLSNTDLAAGQTVFTNGDVKIAYTTKGGNVNMRWWSDGLRTYKDNVFTIEAVSGEIESIEIEGSITIVETSSTGGLIKSNTWTAPTDGGVTAVSFKGNHTSGNRTITKVTVTVAAGGSSTDACAKPTFDPIAGTYNAVQSVTISTETSGATIYYTTDGNDPTTESTVYSSAIEVSSTTTIKAIAVMEGYDNSSVATAKYTIVLPQTLAEVRAQGTGAVLTQGIVTSVYGKNAFIQDDEAAVCVYGDAAQNLSIGDEISVSGTLSDYNGLLEITNPVVTVNSSGNTVTPTVQTIAEVNSHYTIYNNWQGRLIKIENASVDEILGQNVTVSQGTNSVILRFSSSSDINISVDDIITFTGVIGCYNSAAQIQQPRDITVASSELPNILVNEPNVSVSFEGVTNQIIALTYEYIDLTTAALSVKFYNSANEEIGQPAWITAYDFDENSNLRYTIAANTGEARTAYLSVVADGTISPRITIEQGSFKSEIIPGETNVSLTGLEGEKLIALTTQGIADMDVQFCDAQADDATYDWILGEIRNGQVYLTYDMNDSGAARTAYLRVYGIDTKGEDVYSAIISVTQSVYVNPFAALPFEFDGGRNDIESTEGLSQSGLGSDYGSAPKLKFDTTGDQVVLAFDERPGTLTFDIKGNSFSGGTFKVQTSEDGTSYTDLETYTSLGEKQNESFDNLGENVRYIKWIYTEKVSGNVGLGAISVTKYEAPVIVPSITLSANAIPATAAGADGTLNVTYNYITDVAAVVYFCDANGDAATYNWITAEINSENNVEYIIGENTGDARTAYFKVYALDDEANDVYSDLITVTQAAYVAPVEKVTYTLATSITPGKHYIITSGTNGYVSAMGAQNTNNRFAVDVNIEEGKASIDNNDNVYEMVIYGPTSDGFYTIYDAKTPGYLYAASSSSNYLKTQTNVNANGLWSIEIEDGVATIQAQGNSTRNWMRYNGGSSIFSCYGATNTQGDVYLFERHEETPAAADYTRPVTAENYGTICLPYTATITGAELYSIAGKSGSYLSLTEVKGTAEAGRAYIFKSTATAINAYYTGDAATDAITAADNGGLTGNITDAAYAITDADGNPTTAAAGQNPYVIKNNEICKAGKNVKCGAYKGYIDLNEVDPLTDGNSEGAVKMFIEGGEDGIDGVTINGNAKEIYDLAGRRVIQPIRGIYIINGKKVLVK